MEQIPLEVFAGLLGAVASVGAFVKWVWPWIKGCWRKMFGSQRIYDRLEEMGDQLGYVVSEMKVNGGTSIKDHLCRIEEYVVLTNEIQHARMLDSPDMIFRTDAAGSVLWVNRTYARSVQRMPREVEGHGWGNCIEENQRDRVVERWYNAVEEDREVEMTVEFQTPDGDKFPALLRSYKMSDAAGITIGFLGTATLL